MLHKPSIVMAALLAASCGAQAASDADLAAIRSQIDEMKRTYEQRIAALENKLAQAEADARAKPPAPAAASPAVADRSTPPPIPTAAPTEASAVILVTWFALIPVACSCRTSGRSRFWKAGFMA